MNTLTKPKTFLDREIQLQKNYLFVSYSHNDKDVVYKILHGLYDKGVNFWYDVELSVGDFWNEKVKEKLYDPCCMGILWFISETALQSNAIYEEIKIFQKIHNDRKIFRLYPVSLSGKKIIDCYKNIDNPTEELFEKIHFYIQVTKKSSMIYESYIDADTAVNNLYLEFAKNNLTQKYSIDLRDNDILQLNELYKQAGEYFLNCGSYEMKLSYENNNFSKKPTIFKETIVWKLIFSEENLYYFVAEKCLDFDTVISVDNKLKFLEKQIKEELPCVVSVGLIKEEILLEKKDVIGINITSDYADYKRLQPLQLFWVEEKYGAKVFYNNKNVKINKNNLDINAGIRPMLVINYLLINK